jgi:hypothetical protein
VKSPGELAIVAATIARSPGGQVAPDGQFTMQCAVNPGHPFGRSCGCRCVRNAR